MAAVFQRRPRRRLTCYYCNHSVSALPKDRFRFVCPECSCLNRYDEGGTVIGDEPAMRDEHLNMNSFAKRASPTKDRFLNTAASNGHFCHNCRTNQALLINLLSNYLPNESDPTYQERLDGLHTYQRSLQERYPPVCHNCEPVVTEEIRKKDFMAQTQVLGRAANLGRRVVQQRRQHSILRRDVWLWRIRGFLWIMTSCFSLCYHLSIFTGFELNILNAHIRCLSVFNLLSVLWIFWDPTWLQAQRARISGHPARVTGRNKYLVCQSIIWVARLLVADLQSGYLHENLSFHSYLRNGSSCSLILLEFMLYFSSIRGLSVRRPAPIRLISSSSMRNSPAPQERSPPPDVTRSYSQPPESDLLRLPTSCANTPGAPVFGLPSLPNSVPPQVVESDAMDWAPTSSFINNQVPVNSEAEDYTPVWDREGWMKSPTFFAPDNPTGLESLLESTTLGDPGSKSPQKPAPSALLRKSEKVHKPKMTLLYSGLGGMFVTLLVGVILYRRQPLQPS